MSAAAEVIEVLLLTLADHILEGLAVLVDQQLTIMLRDHSMDNLGVLASAAGLLLVLTKQIAHDYQIQLLDI